jgi:putative membrane protein
MKRMRLAGTMVLAMALTTALASAQSEKPGRMPDQRFANDAAHGGMAEIEFSKLAAERASSPEVKAFAQKMVDDHSKANDELKAIAQGKNMTLPANLSVKDKATRDRLATLSGGPFDRAYMQTMVDDHVAAVALFAREGRTGKDPDFKRFATNTAPKLEEHLEMARSTDQTVVGTSGQR